MIFWVRSLYVNPIISMLSRSEVKLTGSSLGSSKLSFKTALMPKIEEMKTTGPKEASESEEEEDPSSEKEKNPKGGPHRKQD